MPKPRDLDQSRQPTAQTGGGMEPGQHLPDDIMLHIGGEEIKKDWSILNVKPGPGVDYIGTCTDLSAIADQSCSDVYASHVLEHLGYNRDLLRALKEIHRVMKPGGRLRVSVPDLDILCKLWLHPGLAPQQRFEVMRMIYGGRTDEYDIHYAGLNFPILAGYLTEAGLIKIKSVEEHGLFNDTSSYRFFGTPISLNVKAWKAG